MVVGPYTTHFAAVKYFLGCTFDQLYEFSIESLS